MGRPRPLRALVDGHRRRRALGRRTWGQRAVLGGGIAVTVALIVSASSLNYVYDKYERLPRVELSGLSGIEEGADDAPENFLIVGIDNAADLEAGDPVRRGRGESELSDTIMVLRIDPASRQAALLSLPRDLWVPIPGTGSSQRINTVLGRGGPDLLIETMAQDFGIPIHHYVEVDFASFRGLVEAVDGVPVFNKYASRDQRTGLFLTDLGCVTLDPTQALAYVRSRHFEQLIDGEWEPDPSGDLGRIARQQAFIQRALSRAIERGARNPRTLDELIEVGLDGITVDDSLTADDIFRLGNRFRSFEPRDLLTYSVPVVGDMVGEAQILRLVADEAEPVLDVFRGSGLDDDRATDIPGDTTGVTSDDGSGTGSDDDEGTEVSDAPLASVTVEVFNGSGTSGQATDATRELAGAGFSVIATSEMPTFDDDDTVVRYPEGQRAEAALVARYLESGATLEESSEVSTVAVITGVDWAGVRSTPRPANGDDTTATTSGGSEGEGEPDKDTGTGTTEEGGLTTATPTTTAPGGESTTTFAVPSNPC